MTEANDENPRDWANESFQISKDFIYKNIKEDTPIPDSYINQGREIAEKQLLRAGARLAAVLMDLDLSLWISRKSPSVAESQYDSVS